MKKEELNRNLNGLMFDNLPLKSLHVSYVMSRVLLALVFMMELTCLKCNLKSVKIQILLCF